MKGKSNWWSSILVIFGFLVSSENGTSQIVAPSGLAGTFSMSENVTPIQGGQWSGGGSVPSTPLVLNGSNFDYVGSLFRTETGTIDSLNLELNLTNQTASLTFRYNFAWTNFNTDNGTWRYFIGPLACTVNTNGGVFIVNLSSVANYAPGIIFGGSTTSFTTSGSLRGVAAPPSISSVSPSLMSADNAPHSFTVYGAYFDPSASHLLFTDPSGNPSTSASYPALESRWSTSEFDYQITNNYLAGTWTVKVQNPDGQTSSAVSFVVSNYCQLPSYTGFHQGDTSNPSVIPTYFGYGSVNKSGGCSDSATGRAGTKCYGCALCSLASMLTAFKGFESTTPAAIDLQLKNVAGYANRADIDWGKIDMATGHAINLIDAGKHTDADIDAYLNDHLCGHGDGVILEMNETVNRKASRHFILATGKTNNDWTVFDPGWQYVDHPERLTTLQGHRNGFTPTGKVYMRTFSVAGVRTYRAGSVFTGMLCEKVHSPIELIVTDPSGKRVGWDGTNDVIEIPGASYFRDYPIGSAEDPTAPDEGEPTGIKSVIISSPVGGSYKTVATGTGAGAYTLDFETDLPGSAGQSTNISGTASAGVRFTNYFVVVIPPQITSQPTDQSILPGGSATFTVAATGSLPLFYQWQKNETNLMNGGNISGSTTTNLTVSSLSAADAGTYSVIVSNSAGVVSSTGAVLHVTILQNGNFESGDFTSWTISGDGNVTYYPSFVHSGIYGAEFGTVGSLGYLSQTISTTTGANYLLSFWLASPDGATPNEFQVSWGGITLLDEINIPAFGWTNMQFVVTATGTSTVLQFGFRDDPTYLAFDDVTVDSLTAPPTPVILSSPQLAGGKTNFNFVLYGPVGSNYVLQVSTNLANWSSVRTSAIPIGGTVTLSNAMIGYGRRFYRVYLH